MEKRIQILPSTLETIDFSVYDFINDKMNSFCETHKGWEKVPVVWAGNERYKQSKDNATERDLAGTLLYPIISIKRESITKNNESKGKFFANIPKINDYKGGSITIAKRIKQDKTANFANADAFRKVGKINFPSSKKNEKIVYEIYSIPQPVYNEIMYEVKIITEYQQQMNTILQPFITMPGSVHRVMLERDGHKYEAFIQEEFKQENNLDDMTEESRKFETTISIKVFGYLISAWDNEKYPYVTVRENAVEIKFPREKVILGDNPIFPGYGKYKP